MNGNGGARRRSWGDRIRDYRKQITIGIGVALGVGAIAYVWNATVDYFESTPLTVSLNGNAAGEASVLPFFQEQIRPILNEVCLRPNWKAWIGKHMFDQECQRLEFKPHQLEKMITRRVPYKVSAEPIKLLELFVGHHDGCMSVRTDGEMLIIEEPENSQIRRENGRLICP